MCLWMDWKKTTVSIIEALLYLSYYFIFSKDILPLIYKCILYVGTYYYRKKFKEGK